MQVFLTCSILSLIFYGYFYCICLLHIIVNNDILKRVLKSVTKNGKNGCPDHHPFQDHVNPILKLQASLCCGQLPLVQWYSTSMLWYRLPSFMSHFWLPTTMMQLYSVPLSMNALFLPFAMDSSTTLDLYALYHSIKYNN